MGKGTDKLYITHSEWASEDAYGASAGSGVKSKATGASFKRLPFKFCALSLQPFSHPVCTLEGTIFDLTNILPWVKKHGTNPVDGSPLKNSDLIKLNFAKNEEGDYVDPVTYKVFTDNTHIVALKNTGNVFADDTVERLNIKAKMWRDLVSDEEFSRKDIITLQDPQNVTGRDLSSFKYLKDGISNLTNEQRLERSDLSNNLNTAALGNAARIIKAREAVTAARSKRDAASAKQNGNASGNHSTSLVASSPAARLAHTSKAIPFNAAQHTTGKAAASLTSTGITPHTSADRALLSDEEYMLKPRRVKHKGYARIRTTHGDLSLELYPEFAPRAVWNFVTLARKGYYSGVHFHRNIRSFMIQGGDPTGTGKGGASCWDAPFEDEFDGPATHDARGIVSMANKGKNSNSSQFFITYRPAKHLDRKHTIFGKVVGGLDTLDRLEALPVAEKDKRPLEDVVMKEVVVFVNPFDEFERERKEREAEEAKAEEVRKMGGTEDERVTWTGKRVRKAAAPGAAGDEDDDAGGGGVGKYLRQAVQDGAGVDGAGAGAGRKVGGRAEDEIIEEWIEDDLPPEPPKKKAKAGSGFGNFDAW